MRLFRRMPHDRCDQVGPASTHSLAILAWAGVAILIYGRRAMWREPSFCWSLPRSWRMLSPPGYVVRACGAAFSSYSPRLPDCSGGIGTLLYFIVRTTVDQIVFTFKLSGSSAHARAERAPSALEQTLTSLGISQDQITAARSQIVNQAEGLAEILCQC